MRFLILLRGDEAAEDELSREELQAIVAGHLELARRLRDAGVLVESAGLRPSSESRVVELDRDEPLVTDGPFAGTKEQLGAFYLVDCADLDEAVGWLAWVPRSPGLVAEIVACATP
jgi:hypothetical protein